MRQRPRSRQGLYANRFLPRVGDREFPKCRRCQTRRLDCRWPAKKPIFRSGSGPSTNSNITFPDQQPWLGIDTSKCSTLSPLSLLHRAASLMLPVQFVGANEAVGTAVTQSQTLEPDTNAEVQQPSSKSHAVGGPNLNSMQPDSLLSQSQKRGPVFIESPSTVLSTSTDIRQESVILQTCSAMCSRYSLRCCTRRFILLPNLNTTD